MIPIIHSFFLQLIPYHNLVKKGHGKDHFQSNWNMIVYSNLQTKKNVLQNEDSTVTTYQDKEKNFKMLNK